MAANFSSSVEFGLKLSKRIYYGEVSAPQVPEAMTMGMESYLPSAVMVYAEIYDPAIVDNPNVPSYQPYVYGRCDPPALIPLHMHDVSMEVDCYLDTAFVSVSGVWRVHCVGAGRSCNCRIAIPMGAEGSVLGVEVQSILGSCYTELTPSEVTEQPENVDKTKDGFMIKGRIYTLRTLEVDAGTDLLVKVRWSQKLLYQDDRFILNVPFTFPSYVIPVAKKLYKMEKILVNVNSSAGREVLYECNSHPLKRINQDAGKLELSCEREISVWSMNDLTFSYKISSSDIVSGVLLQPPSLHDYDQREMFCLYMYPGETINNKVFRKEVVFLVDVSASMLGRPLESVKAALLAALSKLNSVDTFNIIAFNASTSSFSASMVPATTEAIEKATEWIAMNFIVGEGTNISTPLNQAINMVTKTGDVLPIIFLITDGAVDDEKDICDSMKSQLLKGGLTSPRIHTFGIGSYCNHYFLQMLAQIGRGYYDAALDVDSVGLQLERLINSATSVVLADVTVNALELLDSVELYPFIVPDLSSGVPLLISGRYSGNFPEFVEVVGKLADLSSFSLNAKVQTTKDIPLNRVFARRQINALTSQAWFTGSKLLEAKATKLSMHTGVSSEFTSIILIEIDNERPSSSPNNVQESEAKFPFTMLETLWPKQLLSKNSKGEEQRMNDIKKQKITFMRSLGLGFGNLTATAENRPPERSEPQMYESQEKIFNAASNCCGRMCDCCFCVYFLRCCGHLNDQCVIACTQLCTVLTCFGYMEVCFDLCMCE